MKSVIHQSLGHIFDFNSDTFPLAQIKNAFVGNETTFTFEQDGKVTIESFCNVVRTQNRDFGGSLQSVGSHHPDVHPRNSEDAGAAIGSGCNIATRATAALIL